MDRIVVGGLDKRIECYVKFLRVDQRAGII